MNYGCNAQLCRNCGGLGWDVFVHDPERGIASSYNAVNAEGLAPFMRDEVTIEAGEICGLCNGTGLTEFHAHDCIVDGEVTCGNAREETVQAMVGPLAAIDFKLVDFVGNEVD